MKSCTPIVFVLHWRAWFTAAVGIHTQSQAVGSRNSHALSELLSNNATIVLPSDPAWDNIVARAAYPRIAPRYQFAVEVATEADVATTVGLILYLNPNIKEAGICAGSLTKTVATHIIARQGVTYANDHNIDFLAVAGGHGETTTLNRLQDGIQINLRKLNSVTVNDDDTVTVGGGTLQQELVSQLYEHGKRAVTGLCECVSVIGPLLGSGHSFLQSQHGFSVDNIVSANIVLANGTKTSASATTNPELFWALRGAGQNFGIVTSFTLKTYPITSTYSTYTFTFSKSQIDAVFALVNDIDSPPSARDPKFFLNAWLLRPSADHDPIFSYSLAYEGSPYDLAIRAAPFLALDPITTALVTNITYKDIHKALGFGAEIFACGKNTNQAISGVGLPRWNIPALHVTYELFSSLTADPRFANSAVILENYGIVGLLGVDAKTTAVPPEERDRPILTTAAVHYEGNEEGTRLEAAEWLGRLTDALYEGVGEDRHAYVNYANGNESLEEMYGREGWRIEKLKGLKAEWDPSNRFRFYNPIV